jgi:hypothetical protein
VAYARLAELGKEDLAYASPLVSYAVRKLCSGRRIGNRLNAFDVTSEYCQRRNKIVVEPLDRCSGQPREWQEVLVEYQHATPADIAAIRIDFDEWLRSLCPRERRMAEVLATGESTGQVAGSFAVTAGRVSQLRQKLRDSWSSFVGKVSVKDPSFAAGSA